ncbi:MAG: dTDP-rhamnosyl transferase RfbF [Pseudomonadota bacterium]
MLQQYEDLKPYVVAVVVTHYPDLALLGRQLISLVPQVTAVVIVDNGSSDDLVAWNAQGGFSVTDVIALGENRGIATAHNMGIRWARQRQATFVLLMDQDSIPAADMVKQLLAIAATYPSLAAAGPRYWDERQAVGSNKLTAFIRLEGLRLKRCSCDTADAVIPVSYLVSSGCLIPMAVLDKVGDMRDEFFIDYVDFEWGLRAAQQGLQSYGVCAAHLQHRLGDSHIRFFKKNIPLHRPVRHYYLLRNAVILYKEPSVSLRWKIADGVRLLLKCIFYVMFAKQRLTHGRMILLGGWHGLLGKMGKFNQEPF